MKVGVDPTADRQRYLPAAFLNLIESLMIDQLPIDGSTPKRAMAAQAWAQFLEAFTDGLPSGWFVHALREHAFPGEMYWISIKDTRKPSYTLPRYCQISMRGDSHGSDLALIRYWFMGVRILAPTIELRTDLKDLVRRNPEARYLATRWELRQGDRFGSRVVGLGATAVGTKAERIGDVARLAAIELRAGNMRGVEAGITKLKVTGTKNTPKPARKGDRRAATR